MFPVVLRIQTAYDLRKVFSVLCKEVFSNSSTELAQRPIPNHNIRIQIHDVPSNTTPFFYLCYFNATCFDRCRSSSGFLYKSSKPKQYYLLDVSNITIYIYIYVYILSQLNFNVDNISYTVPISSVHNLFAILKVLCPIIIVKR